MSPRRAGATLITASVVAGVAAAAFLTTSGWWGLVAAVVLSASMAGVGLGVACTTRTTWGAEPAAVEPDAAVRIRRSRRTALVTGFVVIVSSLGSLTMVAVATVVGGLGPASVSLTIVTAAGIITGVTLIRFGRSRSLPDGDTEPALGADSSDDSGWRRVSRRDPVTIALYSAPVLVLVAYLLLQVVRLPGELAGGRAVGFVVSAAVAMGVLVGGAAWAFRRYPEVWVDERRSLIRIRDDEIVWADLVSAQVSAMRVWPGSPRTVFLTLATSDGRRVPLPVRRRDRLVMTPDERELVARVVHASSIEVPRAPEDPEGRFSRYNFPTHVGREDAARLIAKPPRADEDLPIAYG
ncbi:hypothetical protein [Microbacterium radiodurans]|uniref:Uncharacterized protein n=1 Tax=Microbacterium radiodurans TaxID=661398 RepID=A0A5J5IUW9_9MICO|nr:hypothetical protein [Microbacterium radiodurans]KAA9089459.1 hypothetical protein F6B42_02980 [Microbacterium radiodurans]